MRELTNLTYAIRKRATVPVPVPIPGVKAAQLFAGTGHLISVLDTIDREELKLRGIVPHAIHPKIVQAPGYIAEALWQIAEKIAEKKPNLRAASAAALSFGGITAESRIQRYQRDRLPMARLIFTSEEAEELIGAGLINVPGKVLLARACAKLRSGELSGAKPKPRSSLASSGVIKKLEELDPGLVSLVNSNASALSTSFEDAASIMVMAWARADAGESKCCKECGRLL